MEKIFVYSNTSCRRRLLDSNKIRLYFRRNNYEIVDNPKNADIIIFVTCAYRNEITETALNQIKEFQDYEAELIVAGCLPEIEKEKLSKIFDGKKISTKELNEIDRLFPKNKVKFNSINDADAIFQEQNIKHEEEHFKFKIPVITDIYAYFRELFIKNFLNEHLLIYLYPTKKIFYHVRISWGCLGNCSYCGIKKAIGPFKSKPLNECIDDFKKGLEKGYKNFVITADDVGAYGTDIKSSFPELLGKLTSIPGNYNVSVQDLDPRWVVAYIDDLEKIFKTGKITSVNIALQSGSGRILKMMNRYSDINKIKKALIRLKKSSKNISFDTHFILGFPTETHEDFAETMKFVKDVGFYMGFIYRFSCKQGTEAEKIEPKVSDEEIIKRFDFAKKFLKNQNYKFVSLSKNSFCTFYKK